MSFQEDLPRFRTTVTRQMLTIDALLSVHDVATAARCAFHQCATSIRDARREYKQQTTKPKDLLDLQMGELAIATLVYCDYGC